ncbi:gastric inhibitory polypeptide [Sylvia atricapilla]|uniref:gastric inhibitory polypeptide n=1 Tax=Sylvia atricapilla TaxID=48155 RepID=UPI0033909095
MSEGRSRDVPEALLLLLAARAPRAPRTAPGGASTSRDSQIIRISQISQIFPNNPDIPDIPRYPRDSQIIGYQIFHAPVPVPLRRRYAEATLASDYSRTMDSVLKKNFVEWLLARREKKSQDIEGPFKREAEAPNASEGQKNWDLGTSGAKNLLGGFGKTEKTRVFQLWKAPRA